MSALRTSKLSASCGLPGVEHSVRQQTGWSEHVTAWPRQLPAQLPRQLHGDAAGQSGLLDAPCASGSSSET